MAPDPAKALVKVGILINTGPPTEHAGGGGDMGGTGGV